MSTPQPQQQVEFLRCLQRILTEGSFVASYKFALLHALADLAVLKGDDSENPLTLTTYEIAERFIELYWTHAVPYPGAGVVLKQNTGQQAAVINLVASAGTSLARLRLNVPAWRKSVKAVENVVKVQPLWKLQSMGGQRINFLYDNLDRGSTITLKPGIAYCFRAFHGLVTELVRAAWLRYIRQHNTASLGDATDLSAFLFGTERTDLSRQRMILREVQSDQCFYCRRTLNRGGQVDHFIPWVRYPVDLGHNFVLAHAGCNNDKSDTLAAVTHLERWCKRNESVGKDLAVSFDDEGILHDLSSSTRVTAWSYSQAEAMRSPLWIEKQADLIEIDPAWRTLPGMAT